MQRLGNFSISTKTCTCKQYIDNKCSCFGEFRCIFWIWNLKSSKSSSNCLFLRNFQQAQLQAGSQASMGETSGQSQGEASFKKHSSNPAINALVTSLMNSAQQFQLNQQQAAGPCLRINYSLWMKYNWQHSIWLFTANAAAAAMNNSVQASTKSNNTAILSLLNSPANLAQQKTQPRRISINTSIPPRVISHGNVITVPSTTGQVFIFLYGQ